MRLSGKIDINYSLVAHLLNRSFNPFLVRIDIKLNRKIFRCAIPICLRWVAKYRKYQIPWTFCIEQNKKLKLLVI